MADGKVASESPEPLVRALFPPEVGVAEMDPASAATDALHPEEAAQVNAAVLKRRREYAAGRILARRALRELGFANRPLLNGPDRAPIWPSGACGSITHVATWAAASVARTSAYAGVGCDVELDEPLDTDLWESVLTRHELAALRAHPGDTRGPLAKLIFSAKEACYKAQFSVSRQWMDFSDLQLDLALEAGSFVATFSRQIPPFQRGHRLAGRFLRRRGLVATGVLLPPQRPTPPSDPDAAIGA